jgi:hypothetical protein
MKFLMKSLWQFIISCGNLSLLSGKDIKAISLLSGKDIIAISFPLARISLQPFVKRLALSREREKCDKRSTTEP